MNSVISNGEACEVEIVEQCSAPGERIVARKPDTNSNVKTGKRMESHRHARKEANLDRLCQPMADEPPMIGKSSHEVESLVTLVQELESMAFRNALSGVGLEILTKTRNFLGLLVELLTLRRAFQLSPRRAIEGEKGVAQLLEVTKGTVHDRIRSLGLDVDDMRDQYKGLDALIALSKPLSDARISLIKLRDAHLQQHPSDPLR